MKIQLQLVSCLFWLCTVSASATQFYTSEDHAAFTGAIAPGYHEENFATFVDEDIAPTPYLSEGNGFSWSVNVESEQLWSVGNNQMSSEEATDQFTFTFTGEDVFAFGGNFYGTDGFYELEASEITLTTNTSSSISQDVTSVSSSFIGVISSEPLEWVKISVTALDNLQFSWPTTNYAVTAIPEPATTAILMGALAMGSGLWWRKRASTGSRKNQIAQS